MAFDEKHQEKESLGEEFPGKLESCLYPQTSDALEQVWKGFGHIYIIVNNLKNGYMTF